MTYTLTRQRNNTTLLSMRFCSITYDPQNANVECDDGN